MGLEGKFRLESVCGSRPSDGIGRRESGEDVGDKIP